MYKGVGQEGGYNRKGGCMLIVLLFFTWVLFVSQDENIISTREKFGRIGVGLGSQTGILPGNPTLNPTLTKVLRVWA